MKNRFTYLSINKVQTWRFMTKTLMQRCMWLRPYILLIVCSCKNVVVAVWCDGVGVGHINEIYLYAGLKRVQNSLVSVVLQQPRMSHARPLLRSLNWLPVSQRIEIKVAVLTYKIRSTSRQAYLHSLLSNHISEFTATLRSTSRPLLRVPRTRFISLYGTVCLLTLLTLHH